MRTFILLVSLLSLGVAALPESEENVIFDGKHTWRGGDIKRTKGMSLDRFLELTAQCRCHGCAGEGQPCQPHRCQCAGNNGCYICSSGGTYICQAGPNTDCNSGRKEKGNVLESDSVKLLSD
ncbi:hypothetical protein E4U54_006618 [Claviceps lovelessii]|nr:hypothetical protein E4U54_006618 [Claviceps lovelessii]